MPETRFDTAMGCRDFDAEGKDCPFAQGHECSFYGTKNALPLPDDLVCDKEPVKGFPFYGTVKVAVPKTLLRMFPEFDEESWRVTEHAYNRWQERHWMYQGDAQLLHERLVEDLYTLAKNRLYGDLSKRQFKKLFKPNGIGLQDDTRTLRQRVHDWLAKHNRRVVEPETLVMTVTYQDTVTVTWPVMHHRVFRIKVFTPGTDFARLWEHGEPHYHLTESAFRPIFEAYNGHKIKVVVHPWEGEDDYGWGHIEVLTDYGICHDARPLIKMGWAVRLGDIP